MFMARFERSREKRDKKDSRDSYSNRDTKSRRSFEDRPKSRRDSSRNFNRDSRRDSRGDSGRYNKNRRDFKMTKVICSSCGIECEVPFKPTSDKPIYCDDCFAKKGKTNSNKIPNKDLEIINEKLDKIIKALDIK